MTDLPNILLIVVDCARSDKWIGERRATKTPNLDRLCKEGVTFPITIVEKSLTTPSFATLLTGLYSPRHCVHQVWGYRLDENINILTDILAELGYHTYAEVSGPLLPEMGLNRGFDSYEYRAPCDYLHTKWGDRFFERLNRSYYCEPWFLMLHLWELHVPSQTSSGYNRPEFGRDDYERAVSKLDVQLGRVFGAAGKNTLIIFTGDHGEKTAAETYQKGTAVTYTRKLLGIDEAEGPALYQVASVAGPSVLQQLYAQFVTPMLMNIHERKSWQRPEFSKWARFCDRSRLLRLTPKIFVQDLLAVNSPLKQTAMLSRRGLLDETVSRHKVKRFLQSVGKEKAFDMMARMFINSYKKNIHRGHGIHVYDFLVKVPLVLHWTGRLSGGAIHHRMIRFPDILPTVLDLLGVKQSNIGDVDGQSFKPLIEGKPWKPLPSYLSVSGVPSEFEMYGVRTEDYKYTYGPKNPELPEELYDFRQDPNEMCNLARNEPEKCNELRQLLTSLFLAKGKVQVEPMTIDADHQQRIEKRLRELGYID